MRKRHIVLGLLALLSIITYLDRVCIGVAGPRMQDEMGLSPEQWGWVLSVFILSYGVFEIPSGALDDRRGHRRMLARIVVWWSAFTTLTGAAWNYGSLLVIRFLFGAGEAGAVTGAMNTAGQAGGPVCTLLFGYLVGTSGDYNLPMLVNSGRCRRRTLRAQWKRRNTGRGRASITCPLIAA